MKNTLTIVLSLFLIAVLYSCSAQNQSEYESLGLKGKVKRVLQCSYIVEEQENKLFYCDERTYNDKGQYLEINQYDSNNELMSRQTPTRDSAGNIAEEKTYDKEGNVVFVTKEKFRSKEKSSSETFNMNGEMIRVSDYFKEKNRTVRAVMTIMGDGEFTSHYSYDKEGNLLSMKTFNANEDVISSQRYEYLVFDKMNNWTKMSILDGDDNSLIFIVERVIDYY